MNQRVTIPIRMGSRSARDAERTERPPVVEGRSPVMEAETVAPAAAPSAAPSKKVEPQPAADVASEMKEEEEALDMWRDRALRLQAEMENFRKRQQRLADERVTANRERLLRAFLDVADDLERALSVESAESESLRQGVELTYQTMMRLLEREGAEQIETEGQPFDPTWHEAISTVPHDQVDAPPDVVVQEVQTGYRLGERLLRPARVVVSI